MQWGAGCISQGGPLRGLCTGAPAPLPAPTEGPPACVSVSAHCCPAVSWSWQVTLDIQAFNLQGAFARDGDKNGVTSFKHEEFYVFCGV